MNLPKISESLTATQLRDRVLAQMNGQARELWGLNQDEVEDRHLLSLDFGLPVESLKPLLLASLDGSAREEIVLDATNRRGRSFRCRVTCLPLGGDHDGSLSGVIVMMEALED